MLRYEVVKWKSLMEGKFCNGIILGSPTCKVDREILFQSGLNKNKVCEPLLYTFNFKHILKRNYTNSKMRTSKNVIYLHLISVRSCLIQSWSHSIHFTEHFSQIPRINEQLMPVWLVIWKFPHYKITKNKWIKIENQEGLFCLCVFF